MERILKQLQKRDSRFIATPNGETWDIRIGGRSGRPHELTSRELAMLSLELHELRRQVG